MVISKINDLYIHILKCINARLNKNDCGTCISLVTFDALSRLLRSLLQEKTILPEVV